MTMINEHLECKPRYKNAIATISKVDNLLLVANFVGGMYAGFSSAHGHNTIASEILKCTIPLGGLASTSKEVVKSNENIEEAFPGSRNRGSIEDSVMDGTSIIIPQTAVHGIATLLGYGIGHGIGYLSR